MIDVGGTIITSTVVWVVPLATVTPHIPVTCSVKVLPGCAAVNLELMVENVQLARISSTICQILVSEKRLLSTF